MNKLVSMTILILTVNVVCQPLIRSQQRRASTEPVGAVKESKSSPASVQGNPLVASRGHRNNIR